jgi:4-hydroxy-tetrahydrodipicolinate synthase
LKSERERLMLDGIVTVLNTPFDEDGAVSLAALRSNVRRAIDAGVAGFLVPAMASEVGHLTAAERVDMVASVIAEADGQVPVVAGCSAPTQAERLEHVRAMSTIGCDGVLVSMPPAPVAELRADLAEILALDPGFLMLQDWDETGAGLPVPLIVELFDEHPRFRSLKIEVVPAGPKYTEVLDATGGLLHVAGGWAVTQMIDGLDRGVHAFMPTGMHEIYCEIHRRYRDGDRDGAVELFERIRPVLDFSNRGLDGSIAFFKQLLHREGTYPTANTRSPGARFDASEQAEADRLIELAISIRRELAVS